MSINRDQSDQLHKFKGFQYPFILGLALITRIGILYYGAYLFLQDKYLWHFTRTGRLQCGKYLVRDMMPGSWPALSHVETTEDLIDWIRSSGEEGLYLTVHPERWALDEREWTAGYVKDLVVNAGKRVLLGVR